MSRFITRAIKFANQHFWRNFWLSLATITVVTVTLFAVNLVMFFRVMSDEAVTMIEDKIDVSVYLRQDVTADETLAMKADLEALAITKEVKVVTTDEVLVKFKEQHRDDDLILQSLEELGENPFGVTLVVRAGKAADYQEILAVLEQTKYNRLIEQKNFEDNAKIIDRIVVISAQAQQVGLLFIGIFGLVAVLVVFNAIRVAIYTGKDEITIMKLVGATNAFVRAPFFIEEFAYGIIASAISVAAFYGFLIIATPYLTDFFEGADFIVQFQGTLWQWYGIQAAFAVGLCVVSGSFAVGKHLKV